MDESDKKVMVEDYKKFGKANIPVSECISQGNGVQSYGLRDFERTFSSFEDMIRKVKMDHLPREAQKMFWNICEKHMEMWSKHSYDVGRNKHVEAKLEINNPTPCNQKYVPYAKKLEPEVDEIIARLIDFGIIRRATELDECQFLQNRYVIRKKDISYRVILNARVINTRLMSK